MQWSYTIIRLMKDMEVNSVTILSMKEAKISKLKLWKKHSIYHQMWYCTVLPLFNVLRSRTCIMKLYPIIYLIVFFSYLRSTDHLFFLITCSFFFLNLLLCHFGSLSSSLWLLCSNFFLVSHFLATSHAHILFQLPCISVAVTIPFMFVLQFLILLQWRYVYLNLQISYLPDSLSLLITNANWQGKWIKRGQICNENFLV